MVQRIGPLVYYDFRKKKGAASPNDVPPKRQNKVMIYTVIMRKATIWAYLTREPKDLSETLCGVGRWSELAW